MQALVKNSQVKECFEQIKTQKLTIQKIKQIINKYHPVGVQPLQPLKIINLNGSVKKIHNKDLQQQDLQAQFYEQKFVPSPDLMMSYQQTYIKSLRGQQPSALVNNKLKNLYSRQSQFQSMPYGLKSNKIQEPITLAYRTITNQYNNFPSQAQNKRVFIDQREELLLNELKATTVSCIQMSIPVIQKSLMNYEIKNLENKNIVIENLAKLDRWKSKREELQNKFYKNG